MNTTLHQVYSHGDANPAEAVTPLQFSHGVALVGAGVMCMAYDCLLVSGPTPGVDRLLAAPTPRLSYIIHGVLDWVRPISVTIPQRRRGTGRDTEARERVTRVRSTALLSRCAGVWNLTRCDTTRGIRTRVRFGPNRHFRPLRRRPILNTIPMNTTRCISKVREECRHE